MKVYDINPHSIIITIGPSNCGKTYFCKNILIPSLEKLEPLTNRNKVSINYFSSDDIRRQLLNDNLDKYHPAMLTASKSAFNILLENVKSACQFPTNSEFIIIDTKGLSSQFREDIINIANQYNYELVVLAFFYNSFDDYSKFVKLNSIMSKDIKKIKDVVLNTDIKKKANQFITIKKPQFDYSFISIKHNELKKCFIDNDNKYFVVSDIHSCYDELINLLTQNSFIIENDTIISSNYTLIINGDFIDKGPYPFKVIDFIYNNLDKIKIIIGNHDWRLYQELLDKLMHLDKPWYDTYQLIKDNDEYKQKFITIMESAVPFLRNDYFITTHAPCKTKYLGHIDSKSIKKQQFIAYENNDYYEFLNSIHIFDDELCHMYHIFGHMMTITPGNNINGRILIDSGCDIGLRLSGLIIDKSFYKLKYVDSLQPQNVEEINKAQEYVKKDNIIIDINTLNYKDQQRIKFLVENKVNFISGTMSPVDKLNNELESIDAGIEYFISHNVYEVTMQQKYMGSRCNLYLFKDSYYMISRNGFKIDLDINVSKLQAKFNWSNIKLVIIDGELMPWSALGEGLIKNFKSISANLLKENEWLKNTHFDEFYLKLNELYQSSTFNQDLNIKKKNEMIDTYGNLNYENFNALKQFNYISTDEKDKLIDIYNKQIDLYGYSSDKIEYKPFAILKVVYNDKEVIPYKDGYKEFTNESMFNFLNEDGCYSFNLKNSKDIEQMKIIFNEYTTQKHYEGVVLKPTNLLEKRVVPYIKVRNPEYLTIIYGYDYLNKEKYRRLYNKKSINSKLRMSKKQWYQGINMLSINYNDINLDNQELLQLYAKFILDIKEEETFDPRL